MSAPLVVVTKDGTRWTRRAALRDGEPLYAPVGVCSCPEYVMATLSELAEHGIAEVGASLAGSEQQERRHTELTALRNDALAIRGVLAPADGLRRVPFELGESLLPAVEWLLARVSELEERLAEYERPVDEEPVPYELAEQPEEVTR